MVFFFLIAIHAKETMRPQFKRTNKENEKYHLEMINDRYSRVFVSVKLHEHVMELRFCFCFFFLQNQKNESENEMGR